LNGQTRTHGGDTISGRKEERAVFREGRTRERYIFMRKTRPDVTSNAINHPGDDREKKTTSTRST